MIETTEDAFLGGRISVQQPKSGYRAGIDPVLLAAATGAVAGDAVLELGCGVGTALLCLGARIDGLELIGVEVQPDLALLARQNLSANGVVGDVVTADLRDLPVALRQRSFQHVIANPPFFDRRDGSMAVDAGRDIGRGGDTPLFEWVDAAVRRLVPKGCLTIIQRANRLPALLSVLDDRVGDICIRPVAARVGRDAELVILSARKGARGLARLRAPFVMHEGTHHDGDRDSYTEDAKAILRDGKALK